MLKVNKKSEYALLVVLHLARRGPDGMVSVAELADQEDLPRDLLAKVMQTLKRAGILDSTKGVTGGYGLARDAATIDFLDVVRPFEGSVGLTTCVGDDRRACRRQGHCRLRDPIDTLNGFLLDHLRGLSMDQFAKMQVEHDCDDTQLVSADALGADGPQASV